MVPGQSRFRLMHVCCIYCEACEDLCSDQLLQHPESFRRQIVCK